MTDEERWKIINAVPAGDLMAGMRAIGDMMKDGATREEINAMRLAMIEAWGREQKRAGGD